MPYSIVHTELAFQTGDQLQLDHKELLEYIIWSIFVDSNYLLSDMALHITRPKTHYYEWEAYEVAKFPDNFLEQEPWKSVFNIWYYYHLITDRVWRDSAMIQMAYKSIEQERWYQISRKIYSFYDLQQLLQDKKKEEIIKETMSLNFDKIDFPKIFKDVPSSIIKSTYKKMLDFMLGKNFFIKESEDKNDYRITEWWLHINDKGLERRVLEAFSYDEYQALKKTALDQFQSEVIPKFR